MESIRRELEALKDELASLLEALNLSSLERKLVELQAEMVRPEFWQDNQRAQMISQEEAKIRRRIDPWQQLQTDLQDALELANLNDITMTPELEKQVTELKTKLVALKADLRFNGPYDDHDVILSIYAGAGGTDAQDWAQMLLRMYVRWAEKNNFNVKTVEQSAGFEAGIKSTTIEIDGDFVYGRLKGEAGVHRLVRLSPFNADNLRQTSFAKVDVLPKIDQPDDLEIDDKDLRIDVYRSGGHGGQSVNTTDSAVRVTHLPTGVSVAIQNERSQLQNKETALTILRSKLAQLQLEQHQEKIDKLKGPNASVEWGNQIRSYVLHPYKQVKDLRTRFETSDVQAILDGEIDSLISAYLDQHLA